MTSLTTSTRRLVGLLATTVALAALIGSASAQAGVYEGTPAVVGYHESGSNNYSQVAFIPRYNNEKWKWSTNTPPRSAAGAGPVPWVQCSTCGEEPTYNATLNAQGSGLYGRFWADGGSWHTIFGGSVASGSNPSISGTSVAWSTSGSRDLILNGSDTGLGIAPETSPSMVNCNVGGACHIAFNAAGTDHLWIYLWNGTAWDTGLGVAPGTTPSIIASGGTIYVAFHAAGTNHLWIYNASNRTGFDTGLGVSSTSSPSMIVWPDGGYLVAWEAQGSNVLALYQSGTPPANWISTGRVMQQGSSPSITARGGQAVSGGHWDIAYQAATTHHLWTYSETAGAADSGQVMAENTSPSLSGGSGKEE
jgi:hypothetical protein